jgi:hypothetical protein
MTLEAQAGDVSELALLKSVPQLQISLRQVGIAQRHFDRVNRGAPG